MTDQPTPSRRAGLHDEIVNALGQIDTIPPVAHRRQQADNVLAVLYREWPWLRAEAEEAADPSLHARITAAIRNTPARYPDDIATAVMAALKPELDRLHRAEAELQQIDEADSAAAAAGSYAERAETAERERDVARQHAAMIAAQRDRLRQRMTALADRWETALAVDKPYARTLREQISCAPFDPDGAMTVQEYTERGRRLWAFRCWGTDTCDGWLGLGHHTQSSALAERERHVAEAHVEPRACSCAAAGLLAEVLGQFQPLRPEHNPTGEPGHWQARVLPYEMDAWQKAAGTTPAVTQATEDATTARVFAALHRSAEQDVSRVIALYERWVKAGPPPLGTSMSRWWDARLVELHDAILPPEEQPDAGPTVAEAAANDRAYWTTKHDRP